MKKIFIVFIGIFVVAAGVYGAVKWAGTSKPAISRDVVINQIQQKGYLLVGSDMPYGVMEFMDGEGNPAGIDMEIASEIAKSIGVPLKVTKLPFDQLLQDAILGKVDLVVSSVTITPERAKTMLFSIPYFNGGQVIIINKATNTITIPGDLKGKRIGIQTATTAETAVRAYTPLSVTGYESNEASIVDLIAGKLDAIVLDYIAGVTVVQENPSLMIVSEPFTQEFYGIATKKENQALINVVNNTIRELKRTGKMDTIINNWVR